MKTMRYYLITATTCALIASQVGHSDDATQSNSYAHDNTLSGEWRRLAQERFKAAQPTDDAIAAARSVSLSNAVQTVALLMKTLTNSYVTHTEPSAQVLRDRPLFAEMTNISRRLNEPLPKDERDRLWRRLQEIDTNRFPIEELRKSAIELSELMRLADLVVIGTVVTPTNAERRMHDGSIDYYQANPLGILMDIPHKGTHLSCIISQIAVEELIASRSDADRLMADMCVMDNGVTGVYILTYQSLNMGDAVFGAGSRVLVYLKQSDIDLAEYRKATPCEPLCISSTSAVYRVVKGIKGSINMRPKSDDWYIEYSTQAKISGATSRFEVADCTRQLAQAMSVNGTNELDRLITGPVSGLLCRTALRLKESGAPKLFKTTGIHIEQQLVDRWGKPIPMQHADKNLE